MVGAYMYNLCKENDSIIKHDGGCITCITSRNSVAAGGDNLNNDKNDEDGY